MKKLTREEQIKRLKELKAQLREHNQRLHDGTFDPKIHYTQKLNT